MTKRALISVTDKTNIVEFAKRLESLDYEIISTGNTYRILKENNLNPLRIDEVTGSKEILDGRVKTLHPKIHGGLLYKRDNQNHIDTIKENDIESIDMVVCNLYNFEKCLLDDKSHEELVENIDIGGPSMIRSASKNYKDVLVVTDINDYDEVIRRIKDNQIDINYKKKLAAKAFTLTAHYDSIISNYFNDEIEEKYPKYMNLTFEKEDELRYGENPHQKGYLYKENYQKQRVLDFEILWGKKLSFNNINDLMGGLEIAREFCEDKSYNDKVVAVGIKHTNPCGVGISTNSFDAYKKMYEADKTSIFGGIVVINDVVDKDSAKMMNEIFLEIVAAYDFTDEALEILKTKKNLRILKLNDLKNKSRKYDFKYLDGKILAQDKNNKDYEDLKVVTKQKPKKQDLEDMKFGMKILKHAKSNAIALVKNGQTLALGLGQTSRIWALKNALENNKDKDFKDAILISDAFFPFDDCVKLAAKYQIAGIIQPGGSIRDEDSIKACDDNNISMVFTNIRHFKH